MPLGAARAAITRQQTAGAGLVEESSTAADEASAVDPWDVAISLAGDANRFVVDLAHWSGPAPDAHVLDPGGVAAAFTGFVSGGGFMAYGSTLLEADGMPSNGSYTDRIDQGATEDGNRQVTVLSGARQARSTNSINAQSANFDLDITRSGGGSFPAGTKVYFFVINGDASDITTSGDASNRRAGNTNDVTGRFAFASGTLSTSKATITGSFSAASWSNGEAVGVAVEPA